MAVCTYDNEKNFYRECWQDGKLLYAYSNSILPCCSKNPIPPEYFFFGANIGKWVTGQIVGDAEAMVSK